ncbi:MAG: hypothetical protein AAF558_01400 [Verrucomicrobiota bacterium]
MELCEHKNVTGSNAEKIARLCRHLASHPRMIPRYFTESLPKENTPIDLQLPWISSTAIDFLKDFVSSEHNVVEFGGGGSTLFFSKRANHLVCIETDPGWAKTLSTAIENRKLDNVDLRVFSLPPSEYSTEEEDAYISQLGENFYDIVLIDCFDFNSNLRKSCFYASEDHIRPGGIIVVDDSWAYHSLRSQNRAKRWQEFKSIGPCRPGITTTDVYFY